MIYQNCKICSNPKPLSPVQHQHILDQTNESKQNDNNLDNDKAINNINPSFIEPSCIICRKYNGFDFENCSHNVCGICIKKYILRGMATGKWKKSPLICPNPSGCSGINEYIDSI